MKIRDLIPPAATALAQRIVRSFASDFASGRDADDASGNAVRLSEPYKQSTWVYSAVNLIADELAGMPVKFYGGENEYDDAKFTAWWAAPALGVPTSIGAQPRLPIADVIHDLAAWAKLEGEFFILLDDAWVIGQGRRNPAALTPFIIARPDRVRLIVRAGVLDGYEYIDAGGHRSVYVPEQVIHWKAFNPYDDWRGFGALQAAKLAAEGAFLTGAYIRDLMRNNGDQGFIVIGKTGVADETQRLQIVADLRAKRAALRRGVAKDLFLTGDITVDRPKQDSASTELNQTRALSHQEVYIAFGVPPSMAEVKASYSIGKDSDRYQLITGTCMPLGRKITGALAAIGSRMAGQALTAELDWDDHPCMVEVRNGRVETALKLWGVGMPMKSANDYLGLGMQAFPGWEVGYLPFAVAAVGTPEQAPVQDPTQDPALAEPAITDPALGKLRLLALARQRSAAPAEPTSDDGEFRIFACTCHGTDGVTLKGREAEVRLWKSHMSKRVEALKSFESGIRRELMAMRAETLAKIEKLHPLRAQANGITKAAAADLVFDLQKSKESFLGTMRKRATTALNTAGNQLYKELGSDDPFVYPPGKALEFLQARENRLSGVPDEIHAKIKAELQQGLLDGDTTEALQGRVRAAFNEIFEDRARTIAATETAACYGTARQTAMSEAGVPYKSWLTSGNSTVRAAHAEANGQTVTVDEPYIVDGEALMGPGDSSGSAANVINCHCVSIAKASK